MNRIIKREKRIKLIKRRKLMIIAESGMLNKERLSQVVDVLCGELSLSLLPDSLYQTTKLAAKFVW